MAVFPPTDKSYPNEGPARSRFFDDFQYPNRGSSRWGSMLHLATGAWRAGNLIPDGRSLKDLTGNARHMAAGGVVGAYLDGSALVLPGVAGNYASVPDEAALDITGDIDLRADYAADDWTPASEFFLLSKITGSNGGYEFGVHTTSPAGRLKLTWGDGVGYTNVYSTVAPAVSDGDRTQVRVTLDVNNGASGYDVKFYTRPAGTDLTVDTGWTQLGATVTGGTTTAVVANTQPVRVGERSSGGAGNATGSIYGVIIKDGINGTTVLDVDFADGATGKAPFVCTTGQTVTVASTATTNDPKVLPYTGTRYLYTPGVAGNYASVPSSAALSITGDIDISVDVAADDWTPAAAETLLSKWETTSNQRSWVYRLSTDGRFLFDFTQNGVTGIASASSVTSALSDGSRHVVRVTRRSSDGRVQFFVDGVKLGTDVVSTSGSMAATTANVEVGGHDGTAATSLQPATGKFYGAVIKDGIDGTTVLDVDFTSTTQFPSGGASTSGTAGTGQTVSIVRSASGRKSALVDKPVLLLGTDDYLSVPDTGDVFDVGASDDLTVVAVVRAWGAANGTETLVAKGRSLGGDVTAGYAMGGFNADTLWTALGDGVDVVRQTVGTPVVRDGTAVAAGMVANRADDTVTAYGNGAPVSSSAATIDGMGNADLLYIGRSVSTQYFNAELLGVAVFVGRVLTLAEIANVAAELNSTRSAT